MSVPATRSRDIPLDVIVLNGPSSAGKTTLAAALQDVFDETWLVFGIDTLISALPLALLEIHRDASIGARPRDHEVRPGGIRFDADGAITVGSEFRRLETAWLKGLSVLAGAGVHLILDAVFLDGVHSQETISEAFVDQRLAWVGVTCELNVAMQRERDRGDRVVGTSARTAQQIHEGVHYDLVVDTTKRTPDDVAQEIANHLRASTL
jgi:chloramphenicol 3-O phosphotransferase